MEAVIFIGIQAVGKSAFYKARFFRTHIRINLDMLKTRHREQIFLDACIASQQSFVVDNTNPAVQDRARYITAAQQAGFPITGYYFQSRVADALRRNATRPIDERVPDKAILGTAGKLTLPSYDEGFDKLYYVAITPEGEFLVQDWNDEL